MQHVLAAAGDSNVANATVFLGVATFIVAVATAFMGYHTFRSAAATQELATEARRQRELGALPWITVDPVNDRGNSNQPLTIRVTNSGLGPAIRWMYVTTEPRGEWRQAKDSVLLPGDSREFEAHPIAPDEQAAATRLLYISDDAADLPHAFVCADRFGTLYRFRLTQEWRAPDKWERDKPRPRWAEGT